MTEGTANIVAISEEFHKRLDIQARNLLFEYKYARDNRGYVPVEVVHKLMQLYGTLIAQLIFEDQENARKAQEDRNDNPYLLRGDK